MDGKFRMTYGGYVLLTVGVLAKNFSTAQNQGYAYRTSFHELGFCLAHSENADAYSRLWRCVLSASSSLGLKLTSDSIKQWHGRRLGVLIRLGGFWSPLMLRPQGLCAHPVDPAYVVAPGVVCAS